MRLILHGWVIVAVTVIGVADVVAYGSRALNAVVVPIVVGLVVGAVQVWRISSPHTGCVVPDDGFPGEAHTVSLDIDIDRPFSATASDALPPGFNGDTAVDSVVGDGRIGYEVTYRGRGPATLGPTTVTACGILGPLSKSFTAGGATGVLAFPRARSLGVVARRDLSALTDAGRTNERVEFDRLREYVPGDPPRDIHWKSSAKSSDLAVKVYDDRVTADAVRVSVGATDGHEDVMAEAAVMLCCALLGVGTPVHLTSPAGVMEATPGDRRRVLVHLSWFRSGLVPDKAAEIIVSGDAGKTCVMLDGREMMFDRLHVERDAVGGSNRNPASRVGTRRPDSGVSA